MSWNFMEAASRANIDRVWRRESDDLLALAADPAVWQEPTRAGHWQVRDVVGHMVDTTEGYFRSFDAARGGPDAAEPLGLPAMAKHVDEGALALRTVTQPDLLARLRADRDRMLATIADTSDEEWAGLMVPHKYMGPLPAGFYPIFQVIDYTIHAWDIREGTGRGHGMAADAADLLVPVCFLVWQNTCDVTGLEPFRLAVRITSGANAGTTRVDVTPDGLDLTQGADAADAIEFDPATFVLTAYGRMNAGTYRGDRALLTRFANLFFRI